MIIPIMMMNLLNMMNNKIMHLMNNNTMILNYVEHIGPISVLHLPTSSCRFAPGAPGNSRCSRRSCTSPPRAPGRGPVGRSTAAETGACQNGSEYKPHTHLYTDVGQNQDTDRLTYPKDRWLHGVFDPSPYYKRTPTYTTNAHKRKFKPTLNKKTLSASATMYRSLSQILHYKEVHFTSQSLFFLPRSPL